MKRITKIFTILVAVLMLFTLSLSLTACGDIKKLELKVSVYNYSTDEMENRTLTVKLYRHLAPNTVNALLDKVRDDFYDNTFFYKVDGYSKQLMFGDLKTTGAADTRDHMIITENYADYIDYSEFKNGGTVGSNLLNVKGSVGLWRTWESKGSYNTNSNALNTGRATWYLPLSAISTYDDWFCVFGTIDFESEENSETVSLIEKALADAHNQEYVIYYTGEYNSDDSVVNNGLTFNCMFKTLYDDKIEDDEFKDSIFETEENSSEYACYNARTVYIPVARMSETGEDNIKLAVEVTDVVIR